MANLSEILNTPEEDGTTIARTVIRFEETKDGFLVRMVVDGWTWEGGKCFPRRDHRPLGLIPFEDFDKTVAFLGPYNDMDVVLLTEKEREALP